MTHNQKFDSYFQHRRFLRLDCATTLQHILLTFFYRNATCDLMTEMEHWQHDIGGLRPIHAQRVRHQLTQRRGDGCQTFLSALVEEKIEQ